MTRRTGRSAQTIHSGLAAAGLLAALGLPAPPLAAQTVPNEQQTAFGERIDVRIVTVPMVARDAGGRPVPDLKASEITVTEGRKTYRVDSLTRFLAEPESRAGLPRARLITQLEGESRQVVSGETAEPRFMVLVVDIENDPPVERKKATDDMKRFVTEVLDPSFRVAVLLSAGEVKELVPFTSDRTLITAALDRLHDELPARARLAPGTLMQQLLAKLVFCEDAQGQLDEECLSDTGREYVDEVVMRAGNFVRSLESIVRYAGGLEGHKSVLIVGGNVSINPAKEAAEAMRAMYGTLGVISDFEQSSRVEERVRPRLDEVFALAFQNGVRLSFVDRTPAPSDVSARVRGSFQPGFRPLTTAHQAGQQDLAEIAARTGGSFVATTNVDDGLAQSIAGMEGAYDLSFALPDSEPLTPRRMRRIEVRTSRAGATLTRGQGFEGGRRSPDVSTVELRGSIEAGRRMQQEVEGENVEVTPLRFVFDPAGLGYEEKAGVAVAEFTVHLRLRTAGGAILTDVYRALTHTYPLELWRQKDIEPPAMLVYADVPPGDYVAEAVVTVPRLERRGTLRQAFTAASLLPSEPSAQPAPAAGAPPTPEPDAAKAETPVEAEREHRPSIAFARNFLGLVARVIDVGVHVSPEVATVDLLANGKRIATMDGQPWTVRMNLGEAPVPREIVAVARDRRGREIGRVSQWLNLPRPWTELEVVVTDSGDDGAVGHVSWDSVGGENPLEVTATLDGSPVTVSNRSTIVLPRVDMATIHLLRVEAQFENAGIVARDVVFGGRYVEEADAEVSTVAVELPAGKSEIGIGDVNLEAAGKQVPIVAVEKGAADLIVVVDPRALVSFPGITLRGRFGASQTTLQSPGMDAALTPAIPDVHLRLIWPVAQEEAVNSYRLFPSTPPDLSAGGGLLRHVASAAFPAGKGPVRLADAVAVAGPMALERGRRRLVLLIHGGSDAEGEYSVADARAYLEKLRVPLVVWSTKHWKVDAWGASELVSTRPGLHDAWEKLTRKLDRQRVVWIEGMYPPQTLTSGSGVALAR